MSGCSGVIIGFEANNRKTIGFIRAAHISVLNTNLLYSYLPVLSTLASEVTCVMFFLLVFFRHQREIVMQVMRPRKVKSLQLEMRVGVFQVVQQDE
jgi:hypothetical protein